VAEDTFLITAQQTLSIARREGAREEALSLRGLAVLTFSRAIVERLGKLCALEEADWLSPAAHPYAGPQTVKRGIYEGMPVTVVAPPMGASPMACVVEDLVSCGVEAIFLVCAAWSLGAPVAFGDLIVPAFSIGPDGTSIHYGNTSGRAEANPVVVTALADACRGQGAAVHVGGNASCEALYRITPQMVAEFRERGCLRMENGEASTLLAMAQALGFVGGVLFQPYIDLPQGWDPSRLDEDYVQSCRIQVEAALQAAIRLREQGLIER
jgi:uridine phosphorylase